MLSSFTKTELLNLIKDYGSISFKIEEIENIQSDYCIDMLMSIQNKLFERIQEIIKDL